MQGKGNGRIGVLGGMGPDASAFFYKLLLEKARTEHGAREGDEYPDILLHSLSIPDFINNQNNVGIAVEMLKKSTAEIGPLCSVMVIACNTAHLLLPELQSVTDAPFVSMIDEVVKEVKRRGYAKVGLLATPTTLKVGLYQKAFESTNGVLVLTPEQAEIEELGNIVDKIVRGDISDSAERIVKIADGLVTKGAECIILGCTELPMIFPNAYAVPTISSLDVLASAVLNSYYVGT